MTHAARRSLQPHQRRRFAVEFEAWRPDEALPRWLRATGRVSVGGDGKAARFIGTLQDISERRRHEEQLAEQARLLDLSYDGILVWDETGRIRSWNHGAEELYGWSKAEALGRSPLDLLQSGLPEPRAAIMARLLQVGSWQGEVVHQTKGGRTVVVASRWVIERDGDSGSYRVLESNTDITNRKRAEEALLQGKEAAEAGNRAKSAFLANMSHEIRTPLSAILGFAELLKGDAISTEERASFVDIIGRNGRELVALIDDILDLSKVEAGRLEIDRQTLRLTDLLSDVLSLLRIKAEEKGVRLTLAVDPAVPETVVTDWTRLRQILINIVGNAVKFTAKGRVQVKVERRGPGLAFIVDDSGQGISPEQQARLFQPFSQADSSTTRRFGGTGLGLVLSRRLARLLGGDVELTASTPGEGSTFTVTIAAEEPVDEVAAAVPAEADAAMPPSNAASLPLAGRHILVAEDAPDTRFFVRRVLTDNGAIVETVENGAHAVERALRSDVDLVLMDVQMPVMDGLAATARLREHGFRKPIVALTAHAMKEERTACLCAGCDDHLTKPIAPERLVETILRYTD